MATAVSARNVILFLMVSLVVVVALIISNNNPFSSFDNITNIPHQTALAIPNVQTSNNISTSASNDTTANVVPPVNHPPVANAGINQAVNENTSVTLNGIAIDPDPNNMLSYSWLQIAGPEVTLSNNNTTNPSFIAPSISSDTTLKFSLTAKDDKGDLSSPGVVTVIVKAVNQPPIANAGPDQTVNPGHVISLDGTKSNDPDDDPITYLWKQTAGPTVKLNGDNSPMATFTAPSTNNISADTDLIFTLTVSDSKNATSTDNVKVTVKYIPAPNKSPVSNAGVDQSVNAGDSVSLDGIGSKDAEGNITSYSWKQIQGPAVTLNGSDTARASFTAPSVSSDTSLKFSLTVKDDKGAVSSPTIVTITVKAVNHPPVASITTIDQTVNEGEIVSLDATKTNDPDGDSLTYLWRQTAGPTVEINDANSAIATLKAPPNLSLSSDIVLTFQLTVSDSKNAIDTANMNVKVRHTTPPNKSPVANAGENKVVNEGTLVTLDGTKSTDPDGGPITYSWIQTNGNPVTLNSADTSTPSFTAPSVSQDITLKFSLTVKDDKGAISSPSIVTIIVKAAVSTSDKKAFDNMTSNDVSVLNDKGDALYNQEKYEEAITYYDKALAIDPNYVYALNGKGNAIAVLGKYEEAITYYDKALAIDPNYSDALNNKGITLADLGKYEEAITYYDKALAIDPNHDLARENKALALEKLGIPTSPLATPELEEEESAAEEEEEEG
jgi:large repetitive protein